MSSGNLFHDIPNKKITAYDIFGNAHSCDLSEFKFRASVYGILIESDSVLMQRHPSIEKFSFPGGGIELDETISEGLIREYKEETGLDIQIGKLVFADDSFFTHKDKCAHGILIFYEVTKIGGILQPEKEDTAEAKFLPLNSLNHDTVHRSCWNVIELLKNS